MPKVIKNEINLKNCSCKKCPSYNECARGKDENLYCATEFGKSECEYKMNGCICGLCLIHSENHLKNGYYCIQGSAEEIG